jgi:hypothetical protein
MTHPGNSRVTTTAASGAAATFTMPLLRALLKTSLLQGATCSAAWLQRCSCCSTASSRVPLRQSTLLPLLLPLRLTPHGLRLQQLLSALCSALLTLLGTLLSRRCAKQLMQLQLCKAVLLMLPAVVLSRLRLQHTALLLTSQQLNRMQQQLASMQQKVHPMQSTASWAAVWVQHVQQGTLHSMLCMLWLTAALGQRVQQGALPSMLQVQWQTQHTRWLTAVLGQHVQQGTLRSTQQVQLLTQQRVLPKPQPAPQQMLQRRFWAQQPRPLRQ